MKIRKYLKNLLQNVKYLLKYNMFEHEREIICSGLERVEDIYRFEICDPDNPVLSAPNVLSGNATVDLLLREPKSFCRFGDGEINLINGLSIPFQEYDPELADILKTILENDIPNMYVGINYEYFHSSKHLNPFNRAFYLVEVKNHRDWLLQHCNKERTYIAAGFNQLYMSYAEYPFDAYYEKIKLLFKDRKLVIFIGAGIRNRLQYNIFEYARSTVYEEGPVRNAFSQKNMLIEKAKQYGTDHTLCFILGPTSKALVYELTKLGFIAWDLGHLAQDYDAYMRGIIRTAESIADFCAPDV